MIYPLTAPMFDFLVLSIVLKEDAYGYQISQIIKRASNTKDSTLYPILRRLQESDCLTAYDQPYQGRNRKYYGITKQGLSYHHELLSGWESFKSTIDEIIKEEVAHE